MTFLQISGPFCNSLSKTIHLLTLKILWGREQNMWGNGLEALTSIASAATGIDCLRR